MAKLAFLFPGQGSQSVGMGSALRSERPELFDRYLSLAEDASGLPIGKLALEGPIEVLTRTDVAQPALFAVSLAVAETAAELGLRPDFVAGHSLGEYTAAVVAGALSPVDGVRAVAERGRLMNGIQTRHPGAMAAIMGLDIEAVRRLCDEATPVGVAQLANLNSPQQTVVSGEEAAIERVLALAEAAGARNAVRLQVGAAFHSELMEPVREQLRELLQTLDWHDPDPPLAANATGELVRSASELREALIAQVSSPVRWVDCVRALQGAGVSRYLELGPGRVLSGLTRRIDPDANVVACDSRAKLERAAAS